MELEPGAFDFFWTGQKYVLLLTRGFSRGDIRNLLVYDNELERVITFEDDALGLAIKGRMLKEKVPIEEAVGKSSVVERARLELLNAGVKGIEMIKADDEFRQMKKDGASNSDILQRAMKIVAEHIAKTRVS